VSLLLLFSHFVSCSFLDISLCFVSKIWRGRNQDSIRIGLEGVTWRRLRKQLISRSYISDANAQRKYEDGKALQEALNEIRAEIARVTSGAVR
jgi:hypothetical protein